MEPITIKARLNQAYHFSGQPETASAFPIFPDGPAFIFREDTSAVYTTVLSWGVHQLRVPSSV